MLKRVVIFRPQFGAVGLAYRWGSFVQTSLLIQYDMLEKIKKIIIIGRQKAGDFMLWF
jgi:hypothetical protein